MSLMKLCEKVAQDQNYESELPTLLVHLISLEFHFLYNVWELEVIPKVASGSELL